MNNFSHIFMERIEIFEVVKPQGIKGELKVRVLTDSLENVKGIKSVYLGETRYTLLSVKDASGGFAFIRLKEIDDRNKAELLRGNLFSAEKTDVKISESAIFIQDFIGYKVFFDKDYIGTVFDVVKSNVDMICVNNVENKKVYFPYLKALEPTLDTENRTLTINKNKVEGVVYYES